MAHTDKDRPYWLKRRQADNATDDHYGCEHDPKRGPRIRKTATLHILPPAWHHIIYIAPDYGSAADPREYPFWNEERCCWLRRETVTSDDGNTHTEYVRCPRRVTPADLGNDNPWGDRVREAWVFAERPHYTVEYSREYDACTIDTFDRTSHTDNCTRDGDTNLSPYAGRAGHAERLNLDYHRPARRYTKSELHNAMRDWNSNGDTDIEPWTEGHPTSPFVGGYWD